jgi:uncharacterized cupredoxin-like copper-binding protein
MPPVLIAAGHLTTGHKIGLAIMGAIFIVYALTCAFVIPRRRPDFPGEKGFGVFALVSVVLLAAMLTAVTVFGREVESASANEKGGGAASGVTTVAVTETEFKIQLPTSSEKTAGKFVFVVKNAGQVPHDLAIEGGPKTPLIQPGKTAKLEATLTSGKKYTLYCSVPGHRAAGMVTQLSVG